MKDYSKLTEITVKTQEELDMIPLDFKGRIYIKFGTTWSPAVVRNKYFYSVEAWENSRVVAWGNSSVVARENSSVVAWENSSVEARGNSSVVAWKNSSVVARKNSSVEAWENSSVVAWENSRVVAWGNSSVVARENSSVVARENSSVVAWENSSVEARGNSSVVAWKNSSVVARKNSSVVAWENSSVVARENSSVVASANAQVVDRLIGGRIEITGNARVVYMPKTIHEYMDFYGIKHDKKKAVFYKAVHKNGEKYQSDHRFSFTYTIGEVAKEVCDTDTRKECSYGIHIAHLAWALDFGREWKDIAILEVETNIDDIVLPKNANGKCRTSKCKVLREVPLSECGVYGKILAKRLEPPKGE